MTKRLESGLDLLGKNYKLSEVDVGEFKTVVIGKNVFHLKQYAIENVGNLALLESAEESQMKMDTFTLTPYFKNLPLFTTDYMYYDTKCMFLNEFYDLVEYKDDLYDRYIRKFAENCHAVSDLPDMQMKKCWYDGIRPVVAAKIAQPEDNERIFDLFLKNLSTFIEMEKASPLLSDERKQAKWEQNYNYAKQLVESGGASTTLFVQALGAEKTKNYFYSAFFATDRYRCE